jgi:hypothetical protein
VKIPGALNMNQVEYPDDLFQGGIFIPKDASSKEYRIYYYQDNLPGSPGPVAAESQRQIDRERNFRPATPLRGRGQLVLVPPTSDIDMQQYVSRPAR